MDIDYQDLSYSIHYEQILINPHKKEELSYEDLNATDEQLESIGTIFYHLANNGQMWLIKHRPYLLSLGDKIATLHPFKFLEIVLKNETLTKCYQIAWNDFFKSKRLKDRLQKSFEGKLSTGSLIMYVDDFCKELNLNTKMVNNCIKKKEWIELVNYALLCAHPDKKIADSKIFVSLN